MKKNMYLFLGSCLFLVSCAKIPYQTVENGKAKAMWTYYYDPNSTADRSFAKVPKLTTIDRKTLKTFTGTGKASEVKMILAAYLTLAEQPDPKIRNTVLLQIMRVKKGVKAFTYYDMRKLKEGYTIATSSQSAKGDAVCPLPDDCTPSIESKD